MFAPEIIDRIRGMVFQLVSCPWKGDIAVSEGPGLTVTVKENQAALVAESRPALARGFFRMAQELAAGRTAFDIHEEKRFESCGAFLDFSRNGVMTVAACKRYMDALAALGMNLLVLYTEDTYEVPEYPYMGYLRGRITQAEWRELDDYADSLGIELVPCIQTLGHMGQMLQWPAHADMQDQPDVLLCDDEAVDALIEAEIRAIRQSIRGKRLHIGMDEAHGVGLGRYFLQHGCKDRFELLSRHLAKVTEICKKYGFEPMMWSDMFFRLGSKTNAYYDMEAVIPQSVIDALPDVRLVYWDYYHTDEAWYEHMMTQHERMGEDTIFAGGVWTWSGFLPHMDFTRATMEPALRVAARHRIKTVMATMWGDDGQETNHFLGLAQLPMFSEACWRDGDYHTAADTGAFLTGMPRAISETFALFYDGPKDERPGKAMIWCDLLYPLGPRGDGLQRVIDRSRKALTILQGHEADLRCAYTAALFEVCLHKGLLMQEIRSRYLAEDRAWIAQTAEETIPALMEDYRALRDKHRALWERDYKRNGWEVMALRYGATIGRLEDVQDALLRWSTGELAALCELEEEPLPDDRGWGSAPYHVCASPVDRL